MEDAGESCLLHWILFTAPLKVIFLYLWILIKVLFDGISNIAVLCFLFILYARSGFGLLLSFVVMTLLRYYVITLLLYSRAAKSPYDPIWGDGGRTKSETDYLTSSMLFGTYVVCYMMGYSATVL